MSVLGEDLARLEEWLGARVLPLLDGEDTAVLGLYYSLLGPAHQHRVAALTIIILVFITVCVCRNRYSSVNTQYV